MSNGVDYHSTNDILLIVLRSLSKGSLCASGEGNKKNHEHSYGVSNRGVQKDPAESQQGKRILAGPGSKSFAAITCRTLDQHAKRFKVDAANLHTLVITAARCTAIHRYNLTSFHCVSSMRGVERSHCGSPFPRTSLRRSDILRRAVSSFFAINGPVSRNRKKAGRVTEPQTLCPCRTARLTWLCRRGCCQS